MTEPYQWTRWAAPGGAGYRSSKWAAAGVGVILALFVFDIVIHEAAHWWLSIPAAFLGWFGGTGIVGLLWALVRIAIERIEGIH
jgi:hypothetical protein